MMAHSIITLCLYTLFTWLCTLTGYLCDQCREGATFTNAAITPNLQKTRLMRVPSARTMSDCTTACCNHSGCDLSWMLGRQCYIVNCQHKESCDPQKLDSMQSYLTFVIRPSPRYIPLPLYENFAPSREYLLGDQDEPKDDLTSLKSLSSLIKSPPLEELTDYADDYVVPQMDFLHLNTKEGDKVRPDLDFLGWLMPDVDKNTTAVEVGRRDDDAADHSKDESSVNYAMVTNVSGKSPEYQVTPTVTQAGAVSAKANVKNLNVHEELPTILPSPSFLDKLVLPHVTEKSENGTIFPNVKENEVVTEYTSITEPSFTNSATTSSATKVPMQALTLSTAGNIEVTLPTDEVWLDVSVSPEAQADMPYTFQWELLKQPSDFQGELKMRNTKSPMLSKLTAGLYILRVTVSREDVVEEGFVNVTVNQATRINQLPVAVVFPKTQEVSLPTTSAYIDASRSTDDVKIVAYHWEEIQGPLQEMKTLGDQPILHLSDLVSGNYTFRLTVTDSDGSKSSAEAYVIVTSPVDNPPVANAGPNQVITLPENHITLNGNLSTDDHQIVSFEWSLSPKSAGKVVTIQDVHSPYIEATGMEVGVYTFRLTVTDSSNQQSTSEVTVTVQPEKNSPPVAETGPDKELTIPVKSITLDGSKSWDDHGIVSYEWDKISGPTIGNIQDSDKPVAVVSDLQLGEYRFLLTVKDRQGLSSTAILAVTVKEGKNIPPKAYAGGKHVLVLPNNSVALDGSKSVDDQGIVSYQWTRDGQSPAAGDIMDASDHKPVLHLTSLVEGIYLFHLKVIDAKGESDTDTATVEVRPDARKQNLVELILEVTVGQLSEQQKDTLVRRLAVLLNVLDSDIKVQKIQAHSDLSTVIVFYVQSGQSSKIRKAADVARTLQRQLLKEKSDFLLYKVIRVDTAVCLLTCSGHGHCDPITKSCLCYPFWMENLFQRYISDGESNCEWSVLYISLLTFALVIFLMGLTWFCMCYYKSRKRTKIRKKTKYTILDNFDEQERMALRPKYGIKHRSTEHNSSLMVSESEFDSDQDTIFSREKVDQIPKNIGSGSLKNGAPFNFSSKCR